MTRVLSAVLAGAAGLVGGVASAQAQAPEPEQDLLLFVSVDANRFSGMARNIFDEYRLTPRLDTIYSRSRNRFRTFGELLVTDEEIELERVQLGWHLSQDARIWFGRFHHSGSFWNTQNHHGQFLQTSIERPAIEQFVDRGGVLPMHVTGLLLEQREDFDWGSALQLSLSAGLSGRIDGGKLETFQPLEPEPGFGNAVHLRIGFIPDSLGENQIGIALGHYNLPVEDTVVPWDPMADEIDVETVGLYLDWGSEKWRILATALNVTAYARGGADSNSRAFLASYAQAEYDFNKPWRLYARLEGTSRDESYLELFPDYIRRQSLIGVKWWVNPRHAITVEYGDGSTRSEDFTRYSIQWSSFLP